MTADNTYTVATRIAERAEERFRSRARRVYAETDRIFGWLMIGQWVFAILLAVFFSPYGWVGKRQFVSVHVPVAIFLGGALSSLPVYLAFRHPAEPLTRHVIAASQMLWSALLIHLSGGRIETHFHVFGSLAFVAFYRDWRVLVTATAVVASEHFLRGLLWPESVYGIVNPEWWRFLEHAFWVVFCDAFLMLACLRGVKEMRELADQGAHMEALAESAWSKSPALVESAS
jgi:hypothetical protein